MQADLYLLPQQLSMLAVLDPNVDKDALTRELCALLHRFSALADAGNAAVPRLAGLREELVRRGVRPGEHQLDAAFEMIGRPLHDAG